MKELFGINRPAGGGWRAAAGVLFLTAMVWGICFYCPTVWVVTGIGESNRPFFDLYGIMAAVDGVKAGMNPFLPNNLDPYNRPFLYSEWWLAVGHLGLGREDVLWMGYCILAVTLVGALVILRPSTRLECFSTFFFLISPAMLMAVNRANNDLLIFVLISLALLLLRFKRWPHQALGVLLLAAAAPLKYYPLIAIIVLLDARSLRSLGAFFGLYVLVLVLSWPALEAGFRAASRYSPQPDWLYAYGAPVMLRNFGVSAFTSWIVPVGIFLLWAISILPTLKLEASVPVKEQESAKRRELICGAALLVGLFFLGATYVYKLVFALWLLPWLCAEHHDESESRWCRITRWTLLGVAWLEGGMAVILNLLVVRVSGSLAGSLLKGTLFLSQLLTWVLIACLIRFLLVYFKQRCRELLQKVEPGRA